MISLETKFISKLKHFTGAHNGKPFELLPYQLWIVANIFGFYHKETDKRVVNYAYIELARKNGKTAFIGAILLYMLIADGENGEFCSRGYNTMKGYYKMPEATAQAIDADGWLHSGDICCRTEDGYYKVTGRLKDMIIRGGENLYPREIEEFLIDIPQIKDIQVAAVKSNRYGEITGAFIILHEGQTLTEEDVIEYCRGKLSKYKWPQFFMFLDEFPMTGSGKIQKFKLTEMGTKYRREVMKIED